MATKVFNTIRRLFKKNPSNDFISGLYSKMSQPLFVHPDLGELMMRGFLDAPIEHKSMNGDSGGFVTKSDNIAVIDISGALTAREENVPCDQSPASYEVIKQDMQELLADPNIKTIVGRFDSPGGMASQNMDLSDFIYASRNQGTKLIAMVDDMAYSAAFGIASAFDEIRVTRTSGVGSVGVVSYHVDQSEANKRAGIKVQYIYAGDKKVLGNPHEELSEEGKADYQNEVDRLYNIFTATVARNLGMTVDAVKATQAGTYHGEDAITVGFAHKMGTFDELLTELMIDNESQAKKNTTQQAIDNTKMQATAEPEAVVEQDAELEAVVEQDAELEAVVEQDAEVIQYEASIRALCASIGKPELAVDFIASKMNVETVRDNLIALSQTPDVNIVNSTSTSLTRDRSEVMKGWRDAYKKAK